MAGKPLVESMNVTSNHPKLRTTLRFAEPLYIAGDAVSGKMEMECKADKGLAMGIVKVELFGIEELTSRDHSATQPFLHTERIFQGPGLPPSNAVHPHPDVGEAILPLHYYYARKGTTTFLFRLSLPPRSPSSINFGSGLAQVRYEVRATVGVIWKGQKQLVTDKKIVEVVESYDGTGEHKLPEGIIVSENGKFWMEGKLIGGVIVPGEPACVQLTVKNHSTKKNSGLNVTLTRELVLPNVPATQKQPLQISDTLASVSFRGPEYIIQPGVEGVANLVFDVPDTARTVRGDTREGTVDGRRCNFKALFEVRCIVSIKVAMGIGSKDIQLDIPIRICHPAALPPDVFTGLEAPAPDYYSAPYVANEAFSASASPAPYLPPVSPIPHYAAPPISPSLSPMPYVENGQVWIPPPSTSPLHFAYNVPPPQAQYQYFPYALSPPPVLPLPRPSSAQALSSPLLYPAASGLPLPPAPPALVPLAWTSGPQIPQRTAVREVGKGDKATRISHHLRVSSRHRSVSPQAHRYALPELDTNVTDEFLALPTNTHNDYAAPQSSRAQLSPQYLSPHVSPNPSESSANVVSPRPRLSPRQSFSIDPITHATLSKSERVEALEEMAAQSVALNADMSGSVSDIAPYQDKTLPGLPVSSASTKPASTETRPRADTLFDRSNADLDVAPPTPTLAALSAPKGLRSVQGPSGLDALEARLLAEVGTRKVEQDNRRPDVRSVLPIAIPRPTDVVDLTVDSAISSLSLPSLGANEGTLRIGPQSQSSTPGSPRGRSLEKPPVAPVQAPLQVLDRTRGSDNRLQGDKVEVHKEREHRHLKKAAQGRITAWLGAIDPEVPPQSGTPPTTNVSLPSIPPELATPAKPHPTVEQSLHQPSITDKEKSRPEDPPNPRSSGFMPLSAVQRASKLPATSVVDTSGSDAIQNVRRKLPAGVVFPPPVEREVHYDVRSARGGRGGKVTAVTAMWASTPQSSGNATPAPPSNRITPRSKDHTTKPSALAAPRAPAPPERKLPLGLKSSVDKPTVKPLKSSPLARPSPATEITQSRARMVKAASVPAVISSSLATPMLSSTASLARPARIELKAKQDTYPPAISEVTELPQAQVTEPPAPPKAELAFGQARLRELIKKYQG